jgi:hypothetical protein
MNTSTSPEQNSTAIIHEIYVYLLNEGVDVWRPTTGQRVGDNVYRILPTEKYDPEGEEWEFPPGSIVRCEHQIFSDGRHLVAKEIINQQQ